MIRDVITPKDGKTRFVFFSGKGGVGKTTISASTAVWLANQGYSTLIVSTDLQLSLNDVFGQNISSKGTKITGVPNLIAVSINGAESIDKHRQKMMKTLKVLEPDSFLLKQMEIDKTIDCGSAQAAVFELSEYLTNDEYDVIVFDNAPTGVHLEKIMAQSKYVLAMTTQIEARKKLVESLGESEVERQIKAIEEIKQKDEQAINSLRSDKTSFIMVMIPEALALAEVERNIPVLEDDYKIPVRGIAINNVLVPQERETTDFWKTRWAMQKKYLDLTYQKFKDKEIGEAPVLEEEVLGIDRLRIVGNTLYGGEKDV